MREIKYLLTISELSYVEARIREKSVENLNDRGIIIDNKYQCMTLNAHNEEVLSAARSESLFTSGAVSAR